MLTPEAAYPVLVGFAAALLTSWLIVLTSRWHGSVTYDTVDGAQKFLSQPVPRIGGVALYAGLLAASVFATPSVRGLLLALAAGGGVVFAGGLAEDLTKRVSAWWRFLAAIVSAVVFFALTGYGVTRVGLPVVGTALSVPVISVAFTVLALAGLSHAVNIIDGFNGLAAGATILMLAGLALIAFGAGDQDLAVVAFVLAAVLAGFMLLNFPFARLIMGDGGAYLSGLALGGVAVALHARNAEVSSWVILAVLGYPVLETLFSIVRKTVRRGYHPARPDRVHLHMLIYARVAKKLVARWGAEEWANPVTSLLLWFAPFATLLALLVLPHAKMWFVALFFVQAVLYARVYRRVALLRHRGRKRARRAAYADLWPQTTTDSVEPAEVGKGRLSSSLSLDQS